MGVMTLKHGSVIGKDGSGTPISKNLSPGPGNLSIGAIQHNNVEAIPVYNRGTFQELVEGQQQAIDVGLELYQDGKVSGSAGASASPSDLVLKAGDLASGTSVDPGAQVWTLTLVLTVTRAGVTSTCTITNWRGTVAWAEDAGGNKLSFSGTAYGTGSVAPVVWS